MNTTTIKWILFAVAVAWTVINVAGLGMAVAAGEPWHGTIHAVLALGFGYAALRLRQPWRKQKERELEADPLIYELEDEISELRKELSRTQEGLDFAEQLLVKKVPKPEKRSVDDEK